MIDSMANGNMAQWEYFEDMPLVEFLNKASYHTDKNKLNGNND